MPPAQLLRTGLAAAVGLVQLTREQTLCCCAQSRRWDVLPPVHMLTLETLQTGASQTVDGSRSRSLGTLLPLAVGLTARDESAGAHDGSGHCIGRADL